MEMTKDLEILCNQVPEVESIVQNATECSEISWEPRDGSIPAPIDTFHPSGQVGIVALNDDYLFNLRANHFVVSIGVCEESAYPQDLYNERNNAVLIMANHKGNLEFYLLEFKL